MKVSIVYKNGIPFIDINGELFEPGAFRTFRPKPDNVSMIHRTGMRLCQMLVSGLPCTNGSPYSLYGEVWKGDGIYDFTAFDRQFEMYRRFAPDAYFNILIHLDARPWWHKAHPEEPDGDSYHHITEFWYSEEWKRTTADYLKAFITYAEEKYGDRIFGYSIAAGLSNEWFDHSLYDKNYDMTRGRLAAAYRKLIGDDAAPIPTIETMEAGDSSLRSPDSNDYRFLALATEGTSRLICYFAHEAQTVLHHEKLFGLFYGYVILHNQNYWNTNAYEMVWHCPDIDMLYSPAAYENNRHLDGVSSYQYAVDSIEVNGKLYLHENDHRTALSLFPLENGHIIRDGYETFEEWREVFRRELCNVMQKRSAFWWFDFFGGYYNSPEYEAELKLELDIFRELSRGERHDVSEIAVFVDPMSFLCIKERCMLGRDLVRENINTLLRCGAPFRYFNLNDLPKVADTRYKMYVFLNAVDMKPELRGFFREKLNDSTCVFLHAAGMALNGTFCAENVSALTGIHIDERTASSSEADYCGERFAFSHPIRPLFRVDDPSAETLVRYTDGEVCAARKGNTVYCAVGRMPWRLWRDLAEQAGVHLYDRSGAGTAICSQFISAYTTLTEKCELYPREDGVYREVFSGKEYECRNGVLKYDAPAGTTMLFVKK